MSISFGNIITAACANVAPPIDARCSDPAFAIAHPEICPVAPFLILKPAVGLVCSLASIQLSAFFTKDGVEVDVTDDAIFSSSDPTIAVIGASSGNATGVAEGTVTFKAVYNDGTVNHEAFSAITVLGEDCCEDQTVAMMVCVDNSRSMSLSFGGGYTSRLAFAKAAATRFINEIDGDKDVIGLLKFNDDQTTILSDPVADNASVAAMVPGIAQTLQKTSFHECVTQAISSLDDVTAATRRVLVIISDGEDSSESYNDQNNPIAALDNFKSSGGIVICLGCRASGRGFELLSRMATGGFFVNGYSSIATTALNYFAGLKSYVCAGNCRPEGDEYVATGTFNHADFVHWDIVGGAVDLQGNGFFDYLPDNGLYVDLISGTQPSGSANGQMVLKEADKITLQANHDHRLTVTLAGNQQFNRVDTVRVQVYWKNTDTDQTPVYLLNQVVTLGDYTQEFSAHSFAFSTEVEREVYITIQQANVPTGDYARAGVLLLNVKFDDVTDLTTLFEDDFDSENLTYVPPRCGKVGYDYSYAPCCDYAITGTEPVISSHHSVIFPNNESYVTRGSALTGAENNKLGTISIWAKCSPGSEFFVAGNNNDQSFLVKFGSTDVIEIVAFSDAGVSVVLNLNSTNTVADDQWHHVVASWDLSDSNKRHLYVDGVDRIDPITYVDADILWEHTDWTVGPQAGGGASTSLVYEYFMDNSYIDLSIAGNLAKFISGGEPVSPGPDGSLITGEPPLIYFRKEVPDWQKNQGRGGDFIANGTIIDGGDDVPGGTALVDSTEGQTVTITDNCLECLESPPPAQLQDPSPLPDIERGYTPPTTYSSTKTKCASCLSGFINIDSDNLVPAMSSATAPSGVVTASAEYVVIEELKDFSAWKAFDGIQASAPSTLSFWWTIEALPQWIQYQFPAAKIVGRYSIRCFTAASAPKTWTLQGSNNGSTWTELDSQTGISWANSQTKQFLIENTTAYLYYRIEVTATASNPSSGTIIDEIEFFLSASQQICATETVESEISQQDADLKANQAALAAAEAQLVCAAVYTSTQQYKATCPAGTFGVEITRSATRTSLESAAAAETAAYAAAKEEAEAALDCTGSNNTQKLTILDGSPPPTIGSPYPSVKHVSGGPVSITKVTVSLKKWNHGQYADCAFLLVSPMGTAVWIVGRVMDAAFDTTERDFVVDDDAATPFPEFSRPAGVGPHTYQPTIYGADVDFPSPAPAGPYATTLATFAGEDANGSWALYAIDLVNLDDGYLLNGFDLTIS